MGLYFMKLFPGSWPPIFVVLHTFLLTFGWELLVLDTKPTMFGKFMVHAWRFEQRTSYISSLRVKLHFGMPRGGQKKFGPQWTEIGCSSCKFKPYLQACSTSGKNNQLLTTSHVELEGDSIDNKQRMHCMDIYQFLENALQGYLSNFVDHTFCGWTQ